MIRARECRNCLPKIGVLFFQWNLCIPKAMEARIKTTWFLIRCKHHKTVRIISLIFIVIYECFVTVTVRWLKILQNLS